MLNDYIEAASSLRDSAAEISQQASKKLYMDFIIKIISMEMLKDESERKAVKEVIQMEEELLLLQLEQTLRDEHNKEK